MKTATPKSKLTLVVVEALSYSGTTWLNLVLGSHSKAFALGPPWRVWGLRDQAFRGANLVWGDEDKFWTGFDRFWDRRENFLIALGAYANVTHIIFDNPSAEFRSEVMTHPGIEVRDLRYIRDGRAVSASYARKNKDISYLNSILPSGWLFHSFVKFAGRPTGAGTFHYEHCLADPLKFLDVAGKFVGLEYDEQSLRFWQYDHHITWGNPGTIGLLRIAKGIKKNSFEEEPFYRAQFQKMQQDPLCGFSDERWRSQLSRKDLFDFDMVLGQLNADLSYERDEFTSSELQQFVPATRARLTNGDFDAAIAGYCDAHIRMFEQRLTER